MSRQSKMARKKAVALQNTAARRERRRNDKPGVARTSSKKSDKQNSWYFKPSKKASVQSAKPEEE